ncbi:hypothetical protein GE09DRAFT_575532 [Coniochaeta sp. 2T2.1]|nr:hypothetical protein GE09DRAFT_575532 [Coniochaeta sp. 2T2.1]
MCQPLDKGTGRPSYGPGRESSSMHAKDMDGRVQAFGRELLPRPPVAPYACTFRLLYQATSSSTSVSDFRSYRGALRLPFRCACLHYACSHEMVRSTEAGRCNVRWTASNGPRSGEEGASSLSSFASSKFELTSKSILGLIVRVIIAVRFIVVRVNTYRSDRDNLGTSFRVGTETARKTRQERLDCIGCAFPEPIPWFPQTQRPVLQLPVRQRLLSLFST